MEAAREGALYPAVANGANEQAVNLFLQGKIAFNDIYKGIYGAMQSFDGSHHVELEHLIEADVFSRNYVKELFGV